MDHRPRRTGARIPRRSPAARILNNHNGDAMNLSLTIGPIIALIAGILILVMPRLLNFIVAIYLIAIGVIGLLGHVKL
jgi:hypothetical protein